MTNSTTVPQINNTQINKLVLLVGRPNKADDEMNWDLKHYFRKTTGTVAQWGPQQVVSWINQCNRVNENDRKKGKCEQGQNEEQSSRLLKSSIITGNVVLRVS